MVSRLGLAALALDVLDVLDARSQRQPETDLKSADVKRLWVVSKRFNFRRTSRTSKV